MGARKSMAPPPRESSPGTSRTKRLSRVGPSAPVLNGCSTATGAPRLNICISISATDRTTRDGRYAQYRGQQPHRECCARRVELPVLTLRTFYCDPEEPPPGGSFSLASLAYSCIAAWRFEGYVPA